MFLNLMKYGMSTKQLFKISNSNKYYTVYTKKANILYVNKFTNQLNSILKHQFVMFLLGNVNNLQLHDYILSTLDMGGMT